MTDLSSLVSSAVFGKGTTSNWDKNVIATTAARFPVADPLQARAQEISDALHTFEWRNGPKGYRFDVAQVGFVPMLRLSVEVENTYDWGKPLVLWITFAIDRRPALEQLRSVIHWFLIHEADEHIFHDGRRVFDPHAGGRLTPPYPPVVDDPFPAMAKKVTG